ncbi:MAG: thioredoxin family protein [Cocleimonas sp.]|nr:thioredoxin family protein [Cocleimonas sp.]
MSTTTTTPDVLLLVSSNCPYCSTVLNHFSTLIKSGEIAQLRVINLEQYPLAAKKYTVRSVPWIQIGTQQLFGAQTLETLRQKIRWESQAKSLAATFDFLLSDGQVDKVIEQIHQNTDRFDAILELLADQGTVLSTRIGIGVVMEEFTATDLLVSLIPRLGVLSTDQNALIRSDACHYLGLTKSPLARPFLTVALKDSNQDVLEIAQDSLDELINEI